MKKITATQLTHSTRDVVDDVMKSKEPVVVYNYGKPVMVLLNYEEWLVRDKDTENPTIEELKRFMFKGPKINSAKQIRKMRDEQD